MKFWFSYTNLKQKNPIKTFKLWFEYTSHTKKSKNGHKHEIHILVNISGTSSPEKFRICHLCHNFFRLLAPQGRKSLTKINPGWNIIYYRPKCGQVGFSGPPSLHFSRIAPLKRAIPKTNLKADGIDTHRYRMI